jgi:hypothetical protein
MQFSPTVSLVCTAMLLSVLASKSNAAINIAAQASDAESAAVRCVNIEADDKRLACYDRLFKQTTAQEEQKQTMPEADMKVVAAPEVPLKAIERSINEAPLSVEAEQAAMDNFGAENLSRKEDNSDDLSELSAVVASVSEDPRGRRTFVLANGQVWKEDENSRVRVKEGTQIVISKGAFSAYYLKRAGTSRSVRVSRTK